MARRPARGVGAMVLAALVGACCAALPLPAVAQQARAGLDKLQRSLTALVSQPSVDHAQWAVRVVSLDDRTPLFTYNAHRLMVPASNQKLLTAAVAADRLGWDYRFTTRLLTNAALDGTGTLHGNLYVVGDGDPTINKRDPERWRVFDTWAAALYSDGLRVIDGHLVGDDNLVDEPGWGEGWSWDDLQYGYGAPAAALQYNENQVEVIVGPGMKAGAPAIVTTSPAGSDLLVDNAVVTTVAGTETVLHVSRLPGTRFLDVRGRIAAGARPVSATAAVENPTYVYLHALRDALARHDIFVGGSVIDIDELPEPPPVRESLRELVVDRSPPLADIIDVMLKWSRNGYAETLLTALGSAAARPYDAAVPALQDPPQPDRRDAARGLAVIASTLDAWGLESTGFRARDGSGLSRMDYVSADTIVDVLVRMWQDPATREPFRSALPQAAVSGTLAWRLTGTAAAGHVWAKTGTLSNVRAISGYLETRAGEPLAFSILVNNFVVPSGRIDAIVDRALLYLFDIPRR